MLEQENPLYYQYCIWTCIEFLDFLLFYSLHLFLRRKWTLMTYCAKKNITFRLHAAMSSVHQTDVNSFCMRDASMKNLTAKIVRHFTLSKLDPQAHDILGTMFYECIIDRRKSGFDFNGVTALSLCRRFNMSVQLHFFNFFWEPS